MKRFLFVSALVATIFGVVRAQTNTNFSGTWTLSKVEPPSTGSIGGGGDSTFGATTQAVVISQTGNDLTFQSGSTSAVYMLNGDTTITPAGDVNGLKTRAHWDGSKLHLHYKRGQNWCRDVLSVNGNTLTILRDLDSGGRSTTRTLTYTK